MQNLIRLMKTNPIVWTVLIGLALLHIVILPFSPPGFYLDEAAGGAHVVSMLHHFTNAHGESWPLFSASLGGGYTTPVYLYPLTLWSFFVGTSELALRSFSLLCTLGAIILVALSVAKWTNKQTAYAVAAAGLILPWAWLQGSLAWDPAMVPLVVAVSFCAFTHLAKTQSARIRIAASIILPFSLIALAYLYPPCRVTAPLLFVAAFYYLYRNRSVSLQQIIWTCLGSAVITLPLALFMIQPEALERSRELSVFHGTSIIGGIWQVIVNCLMLLNPVFLFATGDPNLRHATGFQGMLGLAALLPIVVLVWQNITHAKHGNKKFDRTFRTILIISMVGIGAGILGSVLTNESQPHSLRASAVWPFAIIVIGIGWQYIFHTKRKLLINTSIVFAAIATLLYVADLVSFYPARSADGFDVPIRQSIIAGESVDDYPPLSLQYYSQR